MRTISRSMLGRLPRAPRRNREVSGDERHARSIVGAVAERLVIMADTHVPKRARDLPDELWRAVDAADVVIHAGDWVEASLLDALEERSRELVAVYGNNDGPPLRGRLPE